MMGLAERLREVFALGSSAQALEFKGAQFSWKELERAADEVARAVEAAGAKQGDVVGWAAQNTASAVAALAGLMLANHCAALLNPHMAPAVLCEEIERQRFPVIVGDADFWSISGMTAAAARAGSAGIVIQWTSGAATVAPHPGIEKVGPGPHRPPLPEVAVERLSSGTTGPPKRSPQTIAALLRALAVGERKEATTGEAPLALKRSPSIIFRSLAHAGSFAVLLALYSARPILLLEKFSVAEAVDAVRRYRPKVIQLVPTAIKMIWDADVAKEDLASLIAIRSGTAPLDRALQDKFEAKYGIPILIDYGATEFGGVTSWSLADHRAFAADKRGSVGRLVKGADMRIRDPESGALVTDGSRGLLEVFVEKRSTDWIATNDLASIDADGFLYIHGRADDAIVRGGFKVLPNEIVNVLRQHPDVQDAAVVGVRDERLGEAPVAVIETRPGKEPPSEATMRAFAREHLTPYQVPVRFKFIAELPRSASMKVIRSELVEIAEA